MSDNYLWDGSGPVDPDVERLEQMLAPLRRAPSSWRLASAVRPARTRWFTRGSLALAASLVLALVVVKYVPSSPARPAASHDDAPANAWVVSRLQGAPVAGSSAIDEPGSLRVGTTLKTDAGSRARIVSKDVGEVIVEPGSRVRLVASAANHARLALDRGELQAFIVAPPGRFVVETPSATAVDLGCVYSLRVGENGDGVLAVTAGWVAFEFAGRESFVPAGASCPTRAATGPGLPRFDDASAAFVTALEKLEGARDSASQATALRAALRQARPRDAMTLWHIIPRVAPAERRMVVRALEAMVPLPQGVALESVLGLDQSALDRWWDALGLGAAQTWREWKRPLPIAR